MAYDEQLASRIRAVLTDRSDIQERKMFGGLAFLVSGNMGCGIVGDRLMVRAAPATYDTLLARPHAQPMDFTGRPMRGFIYVEPAGISTEADLSAWVQQGIEYAGSLPPK